MKELRVRVIGRVQGVFFRDFTKRKAGQLDLVGYVSNKWDGSVEVVAQGEEETLKIFLEHLGEGPPSAEVRDMEVEWINESTQEYERFSIAG